MDVKQVLNVLALLEHFAERGKPATLADISRHFDWPRSSTFNLLTTLASRGYLYEPRAREGYYPAPTWKRLIERIEQAAPLPEGLHALLDRLVARSSETAVVAGIAGSYALFLDAVESPQAVRYAAPAGKRVPLHVTATGRALLSMLPDDERAMLLRKAQFERYTPNTLMSVGAVEAEITRSRKRGWFEGRGEFTADLGGVALPLPGQDRQLALLVSGPMFRVQSRAAELAAIMRSEIEAFAPAR